MVSYAYAKLTTNLELIFCKICFSIKTIDSPFRFLIRFFSNFLQAYIFPVARTCKEKKKKRKNWLLMLECFERDVWYLKCHYMAGVTVFDSTSRGFEHCAWFSAFNSLLLHKYTWNLEWSGFSLTRNNFEFKIVPLISGNDGLNNTNH